MTKNFKFDGTEGGLITEPAARAMIQNYKNSPSITWNQGIVGHFFGKNIIEELLGEPNAKGIRIYYGSKPSLSSGTLEPQLILVPVDENGDDLIANAKIADISRPCPDFCPKTTSLATP